MFNFHLFYYVALVLDQLLNSLNIDLPWVYLVKNIFFPHRFLLYFTSCTNRLNQTTAITAVRLKKLVQEVKYIFIYNLVYWPALI